jgi:hypothetical protein
MVRAQGHQRHIPFHEGDLGTAHRHIGAGYHCYADVCLGFVGMADVSSSVIASPAPTE